MGFTKCELVQFFDGLTECYSTSVRMEELEQIKSEAQAGLCVFHGIT